MPKPKTASAGSVALKPAPRTKKRPKTSSAPAQSNALYAVHPGVAMIQKWIHDLSAKTGRTLPEWISLIKKKGPRIEKECRGWLKEEFQIGTNTAWWLAEKAFGNPLGLADDSPEAYLRAAPTYVAQMYAGPKAH